ncbi:MAG TPA: bifunctional diaminohydroxyphosphoribosylaminopyrimidine deaminase/5-amino-6-(5-phosphoribosylamino)uracil reductase RibD [Stellaceae bacterium]|jgi:diaminohydroxyphosphoribosylaminopyrimidine deaminase/5-amino-6-(5-phosphoribosylamino)uracil reductase|nr:bifunctional diaminohydroxyphosphoribosylaminopyrimidine deaminase/5-amino-6-(5-phosphoribosylamino)uracil reductase RibD [Stellaceae bacterium]
MRAALGLARRGLGNVWPNPAVGCVIVKDGRVVGRGWTQPGGRPHAETEAVARAGAAARGGTAYVTLEPCCHWGRTPPCADALIAAGVARVVTAIADPDPRVTGGGLARLRDAGLTVETGLCAAEASEINAGFFRRLRTGRPMVTLKLASSLDGRIATAGGESRWITGPAARERGHRLRATHDAILAGTDTVIADDPELTCRLPGLEHRSPVRVVLDRQLRIPPTARLLAEARQIPAWLITLVTSDPMRREQLIQQGVEIILAKAASDGGIDLADMLRHLGDRGLTRLLVEGGGRLAAAMLRAGLVDRLVWFHAPMLLGGDGVPAVAALGLDRLAAAPRLERLSIAPVGDDIASTFRVCHPAS